MGNQQETLTLTDVAWLAGLIDGDGYIVLSRQKRRRGRVQYEPKVGICNTSHDLIEKAASVLAAMGVGHYVQTRNPKKRLPRSDLIVSGFKRCAKLLTYITPYLHSYKHDRALLILAFIEHRSHLPRAAPYTEIADQFYDAVQACTAASRLPRDQMPSADVVAKLESELHGNMQNQAEMTWSPMPMVWGKKETWVRCEQCGRLFRVPPSRLDRGVRWCSDECRKAAGYMPKHGR